MISGQEAESLDKGVISKCGFFFLGVHGNTGELEEVLGENGVRFRGSTLEEEARRGVIIPLRSGLNLQRLTIGTGDKREEDMVVMLVEREGEKEVGDGQKNS